MEARRDRGAREVSGSCVELRSDDWRPVLNLGLPLEPAPAGEEIELPHGPLETRTSPRAAHRRSPRARAFYAELCGWRPERIDTRGGSYLALDRLGRRLAGGLVACAAERPLWLPCVEVTEVGEATDRVSRLLGASVLLGPREGPAGWRSVVATPSAARLV